MTESCGYTLLATVVESHNATVGQWQLNLALALLTCNLAGYLTVYLVGKPVFASHGFELKHALQIFIYLVL